MVKKTEEAVPSHIQWRSETKWWQSVRKRKLIVYTSCVPDKVLSCVMYYGLCFWCLCTKKKKIIFTFVISSYVVVLVFQNSSVRDRVRPNFWVLPLKTVENIPIIYWFHDSLIIEAESLKRILNFFETLTTQPRDMSFCLGDFPESLINCMA